MKRNSFVIEIYGWNVSFVIIEKKSDHKKLKIFLDNFDLDKKWKKEACLDVRNGMVNGGLHLANMSKRISVIILHPMLSLEEKLNIISHEKRHCEDRILGFLGIDDLEAAAFLSGYLGEKLYNFPLS